jgi:hypothetical protein
MVSRATLPGASDREVTSLTNLPALGRPGARARDFVMARCVDRVTFLLTEPNSRREDRVPNRSHGVRL